MSLMFQKLLLFTACVWLTLPCVAQRDSIPAGSTILMFSPQHIFIGGYHFSIEKRLQHNPYQSLIIAPHFYQGNTRFLNDWSERYRDGDDKGKVSGYGAELQHRRYARQKLAMSDLQPYVAYGLSYSAFKISFELEDWVEEQEGDGLNYYRYRMKTSAEKINRWGAAVMTGVQGPFLSDNVVADLYIGVGYKHSSSETDFSRIRYNKTILDYGYTGLQPLAGVKFGYLF